MVGAAGTRPNISERVRAAVSLSRCRGASVSVATYAARSTPSHPFITGASTLVRRAGSTVPGRLIPTPATGASTSSSRAPSRSTTCGISSGALTPGSWSRVSLPISRPARSKTPTWLRDRPTATASTTAASGSSASAPAGRPPVEASSPPSTSSPAESRASSREATALRDRPVRRVRSARVSARPVRTSVSRWPAEEWGSAEGGAAAVVLSIRRFKHDFCAKRSQERLYRSKEDVTVEP